MSPRVKWRFVLSTGRTIEPSGRVSTMAGAKVSASRWAADVGVSGAIHIEHWREGWARIATGSVKNSVVTKWGPACAS